MAPSSSSSPASSSKSPPTPPPPNHQSPCFTPIQECEREGQQSETSHKHHPTPLHHQNDRNGKPNSKKRQGSCSVEEDGSVSCNKCRPHTREKISVVPLDNNTTTNNNNGVSKSSSFMASPNGIFKSIFQSLTRKSPKFTTDILSARDEQWKIAVAELSHKLIQATRKKDEALLEASRLKYSMTELEGKLNKLEVYCHDLKSGLEECSSNSPYKIEKSTHNIRQMIRNQDNQFNGNEKVVEQFLVSVSEARSSVRVLSRSLTMQLRHMGAKVYERISVLLQPYDIKISFSKNPKTLIFFLEALLNKTFFEDFESSGFQKNAIDQILNPIDRREANYASFNVLKELTWEDVLSKGTRHFSEDFSRFCDRKMSEIVAMLGWNRAWPEPLLQAFFNASKTVWLVHLLANSVHPSLPIFRVDKGLRFDSVYMDDMGGDRAWKLVPTMVRIMVAPGFYVYDNVVKCKVLCRYYNNNNNNNNNSENITTNTPPR
ncbi:hypothetical protein Ddye_003343 [Dipteronia dyeriana]|uniref:GIL1/IRKI C-terminal domain-containing protein n=1 Tax=Dipteronia dyeriana TaxID=168575 RepID=A0AAD9XS35_9ROSI|nr:hypothetical protein Ddye_003343 [Dipteronia dyeriana]